MKKILVPYDFSIRSKSALEKALVIADELKAEITVFHAINITMFDRLLKDLLNLEGVRKDVETKIQKMLASKKVVGAKVVVEIGSASEAILELAKKEQTNLIVLGDHGEFHLKDILLGTTARHVILKSSVPVLVVKNDNAPNYKNIMINTDFSTASKRAFKGCVEIFPQAKYLLYHGYAMPSKMVVAEYGMVSDKIESALESIRDEAKERAADLATNCSCDAEIMVRSTLSPSDDILEIAASENIDLIVLGAKSDSTIVPFVLGSVTDSLLQHCATDMLVFGSR